MRGEKGREGEAEERGERGMRQREWERGERTAFSIGPGPRLQ